jgi:hypothetical protein
MTPEEFECPDCGAPAVILSPGARGEILASCQGCGRAHGQWPELLAQADAGPQVPKRSFFAGWFPRGAAR